MTDLDPLDYLLDEPEPFWTSRRIIYAIITIIVIIAFLMTIMYPFIFTIIHPRPPTPAPTTPMPRV